MRAGAGAKKTHFPPEHLIRAAGRRYPSADRRSLVGNAGRALHKKVYIDAPGERGASRLGAAASSPRVSATGFMRLWKMA